MFRAESYNPLVRLREILELCIVYALIEAALWTPRHVQVFWAAMAVTCVIVMSVRGPRSSRDLGLGRPSGAGGTRIVAIGIGAAVLVVVGGAILGTLHVPRGHHSPALGFLIYAAFTLAQEFLLQSFFYVRLQDVLGSSEHAVWAAALLFSFAHVPNPVLVPATFAGALFFCEAFRRYRNIYPIALAHLALGLGLAAAVPDSISHQMKVGLAYLIYR